MLLIEHFIYVIRRCFITLKLWGHSSSLSKWCALLSNRQLISWIRPCMVASRKWRQKWISYMPPWRQHWNLFKVLLYFPYSCVDCRLTFWKKYLWIDIHRRPSLLKITFCVRLSFYLFNNATNVQFEMCNAVKNIVHRGYSFKKPPGLLAVSQPSFRD